jgi:hypothetical protein
MPNSMFRQALSTVEELTITVTGRRSRRKISLPVWFVQEGQPLQLLPVKGSDSDWYKNVRPHASDSQAGDDHGQREADHQGNEGPGDRQTVSRQVRAGEVKKYFVKLDVGCGGKAAFATHPHPGGLQPNAECSATRSGQGRRVLRRAGFFMDSLDPPIRGRRHRATIILHLRPRP